MAAVADDSKKMITLKSSDGEEFEVEEAVVMEWQTIRDMFDEWPDNAIRLSNVNSSVLSKVIEYCNKHVQAAKPNTSSAEGGATAAGADGRSSAPAPTEELKNWDAEFVELDFETLCDLILAANYLNIKELLDLTCNTVTDMMKGKTPEDLRKLLNNNDDFNFTDEDEEEYRRENQWVFE